MKTTRKFHRSLPDFMKSLGDIANDLRWTWSHASDALWRQLDPQAWNITSNPYVVLQNISQQRLETLSRDPEFVARLHELEQAREQYLTRPSWYSNNYPNATLKGVAYFSLEFGLGEALPLYAGGLGVLAGDYLKALSDLGVPATGIGLLYQEGYFRQTLDETGWQQAVYPFNDPTNLPVNPVYSSDGTWLTITFELPGRQVRLRVWQAQIGRVKLYLLDSNDPLNTPTDRSITGKLYGGGQEMRLIQEIILGIGGWDLIAAMNLDIDICHLNEGHAAFVTMARARWFMKQHGISFWEALWITRAGNLFTTHTPVSAGFDTFDRELVFKYGQHFAADVNVAPEQLAALGHTNPDAGNTQFNMAYLAMRTCGMTNGVSQLHGEVSRNIFQPLFPRWPEREVPISHVTNGVHVPSWDSTWADTLWTQAGGKERWLGDTESLSQRIQQIDDTTLWDFLGQQRIDLIEYVRKRLPFQQRQHRANASQLEQAERVLDPNTLTLGFARRFAEYKRPNLLLQDPERLVRLLTNPEHPAQLLVAGKAHPQDEVGKHILQQWIEFIRRADIQAHVVFLEDYDIALAQRLVQGVDVWINNPRRPWEACGTSGMKVLANGGLNLSQLDGWWAEAYSPDVGWAIGDGNNHSDARDDAKDAEHLYRLLEQGVIPCFYQRNAQGIPEGWITKVRASMSQLAPRFSTNRMVKEYIEQMYLPAALLYHQRTSGNGGHGQALHQWEHTLQNHWHELHWGNLTIEQIDNGLHIEAQIYLGTIAPEQIQVQAYTDNNDDHQHSYTLHCMTSIPGSTHGYIYSTHILTTLPAEHFTLRIIPYHPLAHVPGECKLICWRPRTS